MSKKPSRRPYGGVPIVEIDGQQVTVTSDGQGGGLKRRPLPDGRYYIIYWSRERQAGTLTVVERTKTFGKDPTWAIYRFVCWRERRKRIYRILAPRRRRLRGGTCPRCKGRGIV